MLAPLDEYGTKWVEISIIVDKKILEYNLGLIKVIEIDRQPKYPIFSRIVDGKELYYEIGKHIASMIKACKYSKREIIKEISDIYGIAEEYVERFVDRVMYEMHAYEDSGIVRR